MTHFDQAARRESTMCICGHARRSHGSYAYGHIYKGIGMGPCGMSPATRNYGYGYIGDVCPCEEFELESFRPVVEPVPTVTLTEAETEQTVQAWWDALPEHVQQSIRAKITKEAL